MENPEITVGSKVVFVGPEYGHGIGGPTIGERGVIIARDGDWCQPVGGEKEELITVRFPLDDRPTVIGLRRVRLDTEPVKDALHPEGL